MAGSFTTTTTTTAAFFPSSLPKSALSQKLSPSSGQFIHSYRISAPQIFSQSPLMTPRSVSSPETGVVTEEQEQSDDALSSSSLPPLTGCKACGKEEIERGCNGEGRIQGGIATVPGFGWWPIKAYRPCPAYLQSGGRYRRSGQSMDEVVSGQSSLKQKK